MRRFLSLLGVAAICLGLVLAASPAAAQSGNQWTVYYYNNPSWAGAPVYTTYTNFVNFNWGSDTPPAPYMPAQNWTATFLTSAFFYSGIYRFQIQADDEFSLVIDGLTYGSTIGAAQPGKAFTFDIPLNQGNHNVQVNYRQATGPAYINVNWFFLKGDNPAPPAPPAPPSGGGSTLFPPPSSITTQFGNYTPCAQQQIHQKNCFVSNGAWDAPNMGSIETEPQILRWMNCKADSSTNIQLYTNQPAQSARCSKTEAGYFPG